MRDSLTTVEQLLNQLRQQQQVETLAEIGQSEMLEALFRLPLNQFITGNLSGAFCKALNITVESLPTELEIKIRCLEPLLQKLNQLPVSSAELMSKIRQAIPRIAGLVLQDPDFPQAPGALCELLMNRIHYLAVTLNYEDPGCKLLSSSLHDYLDFLNSENAYEQVATAFVKFADICDKQLQRCRLLEKRRIEAESGQLRLNMARTAAEQLMAQLSNADQQAAALLKTITPHWQQLLFLQFLKSDPQEWHRLTDLYLLLQISLSELKEKDDFDAVKALLPKLMPRVRDRLSSIGLSNAEVDKLMTALATAHKNQLASLKKQFSTGPDSADIIRLKPANPFASSAEASAPETSEDKASSPQQQLLKSWYQSHPELKSFVKDIFASLTQPVQSTASANTHLVTGRWYLLPMDICSQAVKLAKVFEDGTHYFVFVSGNKAAALKTEECDDLYASRQIRSIELNDFVEKVLNATLTDWGRTLGSQLARLQFEQTRAEEENKPAQSADMAARPQQQNAIGDESSAKVELPTFQSAEQILELTVGSWITYIEKTIEKDTHTEKGTQKRCRLAAKIRGGQQFVFTNREGLRVLTLSADELVDAFQEQRLTVSKIAHTQSEQGLQSMISSMRDMKNQ